MKKIISLVVLCVAIATVFPNAQDRTSRVDRVLQQYVDDNQVAGAVALVLQDCKPVY